MANPALQGLKAATIPLKPVSGDQAPAPQAAVGKTPDGSVAAYQGPDQGPFECDNCEYYVDPGNCKRPEVLQEVGDPDGDGLADVDAKGCCNFFENLGHADTN
jgi:hypothetical protein